MQREKTEDLDRQLVSPSPGIESLAGVLGHNQIGPGGAERLTGVLVQCAALTHLDLCANGIGTVGRGRLQASWCGQASVSGLHLWSPCTACSLSSSRQATRKIDILYTNRVVVLVVFGLTLSL
jgi:hypothetical protein